jgi:hypothetical protein
MSQWLCGILNVAQLWAYVFTYKETWLTSNPTPSYPGDRSTCLTPAPMALYQSGITMDPGGIGA